MKKRIGGPDYNTALMEQRQQNLLDFNILDPNVVEKLQKLSARLGIGVNEILDFTRDQLFALILGKDAGKQGIHEKTAAEYINAGLEWITQREDEIDCTPLTILPKNGESSLKIIGGRVLPPNKYKALGPVSKKIKTVDFHTEILVCRNGFVGLVDVYASHKFTQGAGGAQDNQLTDIELFLKETKQAEKDESVLFLAIVDGDYYQKRGPDGKTPIENLRSLYETANTHICTTEDLMDGNLLLDYLADLIA